MIQKDFLDEKISQSGNHIHPYIGLPSKQPHFTHVLHLD